ncbi:MAG TPA: preprotein translocase subunit SecE [Longimicrobiales bacterium]
MISLARARAFGTETIEELKKVTWPDWPQLKNATAVIIVFVLIVALIIWVMDLGVRTLLTGILELLT